LEVSAVPSRKSLLAELPYVQLEVSGTSALVGADESDPGSQDWFARVTATVASGPETSHWHHLDGAALRTKDLDKATTEATIFEASGLTLDLYRTDDPFASLDARSQDYAHFLGLFDADGELTEDLDCGAFGNSLVIIDRARLAPAWRGLGGVGRLLIGELLPWICSSPQLVAVHPFPTDLDREQKRDDAVFKPALEQVRRTWRSLAFEPFSDDVWVMHPEKRTHSDALEQLRHELIHQ
jgi:hypothetical protein